MAAGKGLSGSPALASNLNHSPIIGGVLRDPFNRKPGIDP
jgi:hypothetical protein